MRIRASVSTLTFALALTCSLALGAQMPQRGPGGCSQDGGGCGHDGGMCSHAGQTEQPGPGRHGGPGGRAGAASHREAMATIHFLIDHHDQVVREVEEIEGGVLTTTRSPKNPELVPVIQRHVLEM